eukprot:TRINITY_DN6616_c0_g1_i2.p1 TRINITY_DN6616_c0_g1~~TRINITY_DN6616_c0_g1_i2.p1  ORF type:complete len:150 (-),score=10.86 TRINITY_DN6616_c0_g1_i2:75-524(-)
MQSKILLAVFALTWVCCVAQMNSVAVYFDSLPSCQSCLKTSTGASSACTNNPAAFDAYTVGTPVNITMGGCGGLTSVLGFSGNEGGFLNVTFSSWTACNLCSKVLNTINGDIACNGPTIQLHQMAPPVGFQTNPGKACSGIVGVALSPF